MPLDFDGQLARFDITINADKYDSWQDLYEKISKWCNKFCFQKEKGADTGYVHYQCRVNLMSKKTCAAMLSDVIPAIGGHWSVTSKGVHSGPKAFNYVMKEDTRLEGPWDDSTQPKERNLTPQLVKFMQLHEEGKLYPWQLKIKDIVCEYDERKLHYFYDPHYNSGKSITCEWLEYLDLAEEIPGIMTLAEDIMQFVMCMPVAKCYLFDMPAAMKKEKMHQMYTALEMLKNGFLYDKCYNGKKKRIARPGVCCFANNLPQADIMAPDRWQVWYITPHKDLVEYDAAIHPL